MALISVQAPRQPQKVLVVGAPRVEAGDQPQKEKETPGVVAAAADDTGDQPDISWFFAALGLIAGGVGIGTALLPVQTGVVFNPPAGIDTFAVFYVLAQALERLAELVAYIPNIGATKSTVAGAKRITKQDAINKRNKAIAATLNDPALGKGEDGQTAQAAKAQQVLDRVRANRAVFFWALNSAAASIGCAWLKLSLLTIIGVSGTPAWFGILVTGLVVGGGTKPLHDLITNIQKAKESREDPPQVAA